MLSQQTKQPIICVQTPTYWRSENDEEQKSPVAIIVVQQKNSKPKDKASEEDGVKFVENFK
jgi:hypothetical protein